jgi:hypothetical protein
VVNLNKKKKRNISKVSEMNSDILDEDDNKLHNVNKKDNNMNDFPNILHSSVHLNLEFETNTNNNISDYMKNDNCGDEFGFDENPKILLASDMKTRNKKNNKKKEKGIFEEKLNLINVEDYKHSKEDDDNMVNGKEKDKKKHRNKNKGKQKEKDKEKEEDKDKEKEKDKRKEKEDGEKDTHKHKEKEEGEKDKHKHKEKEEGEKDKHKPKEEKDKHKPEEKTNNSKHNKHKEKDKEKVGENLNESVEDRKEKKKEKKDIKKKTKEKENNLQFSTMSFVNENLFDK